jgi:hypothetical protein
LVQQEAAVRQGENGATGWLDHLFLDDQGVPTLVEVKRSTDPRIRREVVGQLLDYASNMAFDWPVERLQRSFDETCKTCGRDPAETLDDFLQAEIEPEEFWENAKTNLQAGKIRLLFVADRLPSELRRIIEFLNKQMDPCEVLGIEIRQFTGDGVRTLVPSIVGRTEEAQLRKRSDGPANQWDEASYFERLEQTTEPKTIEAARALLAWSKANSKYVFWGKGKTQGSFGPSIWVDGVKHNPIVVYSGTKGDPVVEISFQWMAAKPPFDDEAKRLELLTKLNQIEGVNLPPDSIVRRPSIRLASFAEPAKNEQLLAVLRWYVEQIHEDKRS